ENAGLQAEVILKLLPIQDVRFNEFFGLYIIVFRHLGSFKLAVSIYFGNMFDDGAYIDCQLFERDRIAIVLFIVLVNGRAQFVYFLAEIVDGSRTFSCIQSISNVVEFMGNFIYSVF